MIKRYRNLFNFIKEMPSLKDSIIIFPHNIEEQFMLLSAEQCKRIKNDIKRLNIKIIVERDLIYENKNIQKSI